MSKEMTMEEILDLFDRKNVGNTNTTVKANENRSINHSTNITINNYYINYITEVRIEPVEQKVYNGNSTTTKRRDTLDAIIDLYNQIF
ncbi:hypothetical protein [Romboutsia sp.]|uniref:hypothetical protein n=1 Tax=Romboutsia sp. TaxID=1965302 RepID=UPI003F2AE5F3